MRFRLSSRVAGALFVGVLVTGGAQAGDTPPTLSGAKLVSAEDVVKVQAGGAAVIDARVASEYTDGHIKGAINVPYREKSAKDIEFDPSQDEFNLARLPADKSAPIVVYCNGPECWKSFKASAVAIKGGYTNVHWYRAGFPDWKAKSLPVE
jgi:rhodanese-related sulfurtransferase